MRVLLPDAAKVKTESGDIPAKDLVSGAQCMAYDTGRREVCWLPVTVSRVEGEFQFVNVFIQHGRWLDLLKETQAYINGGPVPVGNYPNMFVTYCPMNPGRFTPRYLADLRELGRVTSAVQLDWDARVYLSVEGLLVGS